jgi:predicted NodU family carbamoyl transferase
MLPPLSRPCWTRRSSALRAASPKNGVKNLCLAGGVALNCVGPVLVNTSFNVRGEPIVCTPKDAFRCFMGNELDLLVVGRCVLHKSEQDDRLKQDYSFAFEPD